MFHLKVRICGLFDPNNRPKRQNIAKRCNAFIILFNVPDHATLCKHFGVMKTLSSTCPVLETKTETGGIA